MTWRNGTNPPVGSRFCRAARHARRPIGARDNSPRKFGCCAEARPGPEPGAASTTSSRCLRPPRWRQLFRSPHPRWAIEQHYQDFKTELGLDHFEGRTYPGWQHHMVISAVAYAFFQGRTPQRPFRATLTTDVSAGLCVRTRRYSPACSSLSRRGSGYMHLDESGGTTVSSTSDATLQPAQSILVQLDDHPRILAHVNVYPELGPTCRSTEKPQATLSSRLCHQPLDYVRRRFPDGVIQRRTETHCHDASRRFEALGGNGSGQKVHSHFHIHRRLEAIAVRTLHPLGPRGRHRSKETARDIDGQEDGRAFDDSLKSSSLPTGRNFRCEGRVR